MLLSAELETDLRRSRGGYGPRLSYIRIGNPLFPAFRLDSEYLPVWFGVCLQGIELEAGLPFSRCSMVFCNFAAALRKAFQKDPEG